VPGQGRLGDKASVPLDMHGCPACPHPGSGPAILGSPDVNVNRRPALRLGDPGLHTACCGGNTWKANAGSATVFINGKSAHRMGDQTQHCGGTGQLIEGSPNVMVGETASAGAAQAASSSTSTSSAGSSATSPMAASASTGSSSTGSSSTGSSSTAGASAASASASTAHPSAAPSAAPAASGEEAPAPPDEPQAWLEVELIGEDGQGVVGERYVIAPPTGAPITGFLDEDGRARLDGLVAGTCQISFPDLDSEAWQSAT
jgi:uncharacterized Zn-binding protein involved in type VI secretion